MYALATGPKEANANSRGSFIPAKMAQEVAGSVIALATHATHYDDVKRFPESDISI